MTGFGSPGALARLTRLPRTRGDGPLAPSRLVDSKVAPPHTRGWTHASDFGDPQLLGSPAHAGIGHGQLAVLTWLTRGSACCVA